jgi:spore maturation protein CgeB
MKIDLIFPEYFTWSSSLSVGMVQAAQKLGILGRAINISMCSERAILSLADSSADAMIFFGGCEHSPRLYDTHLKRQILSDISVPKASMVVESFEFDDLDRRQFPNISRHKEEVFAHAKYFSHIFVTDERDVGALRAHSPITNAHWLPMCADIDAYIPIACSKSVDYGFVGTRYEKRKKSIDEFAGFGLNIDAVKANAKERDFFLKMAANGNMRRIFRTFSKLGIPDPFLGRKMVKSWERQKNLDTITLNQVYNSSKITFNLPGPHKGFTNRTFEMMAAGSVVAQNVGTGREKSISLFGDQDEILYYDENNIEEAADKIIGVANNPAKRRAMSVAAREAIERNHSCQKRLVQILDLLTASPTSETTEGKSKQ